MKERRSTSPLKISLLPYHSIAKNKYARFHIDNKMKHLKDLTKESLIPIKKEFEAEGFQVKIGSWNKMNAGIQNAECRNSELKVDEEN